jgi:hypothetical protein
MILSASQEMYDMGLLSQECGGLGSDDDESVDCNAATPVQYHSSNAYKDMHACMDMALDKLQGKPGLMAKYASKFHALNSEIFEDLRKECARPEDMMGEIVSLFAGHDQRKKGRRIPSATEPNRKKRRVAKTPTKLSLDSIVL